MEPRGWFADVDNNDGDKMDGWQPCFQLEGMCQSFDIWFKTEADCVAFIRDEIIPFASQMA